MKSREFAHSANPVDPDPDRRDRRAPVAKSRSALGIMEGTLPHIDRPGSLLSRGRVGGWVRPDPLSQFGRRVRKHVRFDRESAECPEHGCVHSGNPGVSLILGDISSTIRRGPRRIYDEIGEPGPCKAAETML